MLLLDRAHELTARRRVLWLLVVRDLKVRYSSSVLGYLWTVIDPLLMSTVYWFVFGVVFGGARAGVGLKPYVLYLVIGVLAWQWFAGGVNDTTRALQQESKLIRSTSLPREIWVLKIVGAKGVEFVLALPVVLLFMVVYRHPPTWNALWCWPLAVVLQATLISGLGLALSAVTVLMTDLKRVVRIVVMMLFYLTPVVYSVNRIPNRYHAREVLVFNPMSGILDLYRRGVFPDTGNGWHVPLIGAGMTVLVLLAGIAVFHRLERAVLKEI
jgi:ABC-2 type transport system permease protein